MSTINVWCPRRSDTGELEENKFGTTLLQRTVSSYRTQHTPTLCQRRMHMYRTVSRFCVAGESRSLPHQHENPFHLKRRLQTSMTLESWKKQAKPSRREKIQWWWWEGELLPFHRKTEHDREGISLYTRQGIGQRAMLPYQLHPSKPRHGISRTGNKMWGNARNCVSYEKQTGKNVLFLWCRTQLKIVPPRFFPANYPPIGVMLGKLVRFPPWRSTVVKQSVAVLSHRVKIETNGTEWRERKICTPAHPGRFVWENI